MKNQIKLKKLANRALMNSRTLLKFQLLTFLFILAACSTNNDKKLSEIEFTGRYNDLFEYHNVINVAIANQDKLIYYLFENPIDNADKLINESVSNIKSLRNVELEDNKIENQLKEFINFSINYYEDLGRFYKNKDLDGAIKLVIEHKKINSTKLFTQIKKEYKFLIYVNISEKEIQKKINKDNYTKSTLYKPYKKIKLKHPKKAKALLEKIISQTENFQERSIYIIESADESVMAFEPSSVALKKYESIFNQKEYSLYLMEAWLKWRTVYQSEFGGSSRNSKIFNHLYDKKRKEVAQIIFKQIQDNPKDKMAKKQFVALITEDIVRLYGEYPYGNQNIVFFNKFFLKVH